VQEGDEVYLLSLNGTDIVKVRHGLMDVKHLEEVDDRGLERWRPVLKAGFPLDAEDARFVLAALGMPAPPPGRAADTVEALLAELPDPRAVRTVAVHKHRRAYTLGGCAVELTDVRAGGADVQTLAVESEDPDRVAATVRGLGLDTHPNTNYQRALRELVGLGGRRAAVIDVGTNSVKFHLAERSADGRWRTLVDRSEITRLGEGLREAGALGPAPMERTIDAICGMAGEARNAGAMDIAAVGTAALRIAANSAELVDAARDRCGVRVEVISGDEESRLGYLAVRPLIDRTAESIVVFETGGGSSQITFASGDRIDEQFSLNVGAAGLTERYRLDRVVSAETLREALAAAAEELSPLDGRPRPDALIGMGGAFTNLAAVKHRLATYAPDVVEGTVLDRAEIDRQIELYRTRTSDQRRGIVGLQPARAEVILAGACIVRTVLDKLDRESVTVSDRGLRHGLLLERFERGAT
jgi:exopolyphosphatase/guanosine-5'-triphosphate,3'-diphosphate pyrophosphatase